NDYFGRRTAEIRNSKLEIQNKRSLPENYFLASARFIEKKNLSTLIEAYAEYRRLCKESLSDAEQSQVAGNPPSPRLRRTGAPWDLVVLGDGPLRETLNSQLSTLKLNEHVHLPGFEPYDELPVYYEFANGFG